MRGIRAITQVRPPSMVPVECIAVRLATPSRSCLNKSDMLSSSSEPETKRARKLSDLSFVSFDVLSSRSALELPFSTDCRQVYHFDTASRCYRTSNMMASNLRRLTFLIPPASQAVATLGRLLLFRLLFGYVSTIASA